MEKYRDLFVTVVAPVYNRKDTILRALQSEERHCSSYCKKSGIKLDCGEMYMCNDPDDESLPNAVDTFVNAWKMIHKEQRDLYFEKS